MEAREVAASVTAVTASPVTASRTRTPQQPQDLAGDEDVEEEGRVLVDDGNGGGVKSPRWQHRCELAAAVCDR